MSPRALVACPVPTCNAAPGEGCKTPNGYPNLRTHPSRLAAQVAALEAELAGAIEAIRAALKEEAKDFAYYDADPEMFDRLYALLDQLGGQ